ncbi:DNA recombination protein RmuC [Marinicella sp. W31]|uniref:DNA recombination protein RmuC n=1 Tax=Marinicella sp. W31 TaxID=3023713 RepID=UPI00375798C8
MQKIASLIELYPLISIAASLGIGVLLTWLVCLWVFRKKITELKLEKSEVEMQMELSVQQLQQAEQYNQQLSTDKKIADDRLFKISRNESALREKVAHLTELSSRFREVDDLREQMHAENVSLRTRMEEQNKNIVEQQQFIKDSEETLRQQFHRMTEKVLEEKSQKFTKQNQENIKGLLNPLHQQMSDFQKLVNDNQAKRQSQHEVLNHQLEQLKNLNQNISEEAHNLTLALKSESKTQGNWGELILKRVLESSGLQEGREFETEKSYKSEGNTYRPDVVIHLPKGKDMIIDSKVSLSDYERYINAPENEKEQHLNDHINSIKRHIDQLAKKPYQSLDGMKTLDYILMFIPVEAAYLEAMNAQPSLFENAFKKNILVLSTSNLLATLKTVAVLWKNEDQNKNAIKIAHEAGLMYNKFVSFVENLDEIKMRLDKATEAWHAAENKLKSGRGNLIGKTEKLKKLGVNAQKLLSDQWQEDDNNSSD